ncbi:ferredoxin--NADP reductase [Dyadobacter fanqingshengii]|uniref:Ferredoxin--NADP reductase n=1 Tax=Dyadobacter fanqingshengii TaxID=2906443 RepID=A0A9X1P7G5_9BACT|nr:ferredoxin--NADP reductase [Dyadobacter fanqingshengii]MCF0039377.1 ferredoxin--NADP reductase [Dyadobacter fanqingshengii]USJ33809.1 ferredoxin--NADP reductase [Dyadobacter fanqingshengii]
MSEATISLRVKHIINEAADAKTFVFERTNKQAFTYKAGQFLTFLIPVHGHETRRSYSMSSAPDVDEDPAITVKRVPNGEISRFWIDHVKIGHQFNVLPPSGRFVLEDALGTSRDIVLIAAGSGITPLFSILKQTLTQEKESNITLLYASRNVQHALFHNQIQKWQENFPERLKVVHIHSQPLDDWNGLRGRINNTRLEQLISKSLHFQPQSARFFICGPYELMRSVEITLHYMGFSSLQVRKENFVIPSPPPSPPVSYPHVVKLNFHGRMHDLFVPAHTTILDAALAAGIYLPYSCKGGRCATCAGLCKRGKVHMSVNEVLTDRDLQDGWILTCSAYADSEDVSIEII